MFKKVKPLVLVVILAALVGIYFIVQNTGSKDRTFKDKVLEFDPATVTEVMITIPGQAEKTHLKLEGEAWKVFISDRAYSADSNAVRSMLAQLSQLATKRFAGRSKEIVRKYELTDSLAVNVLILGGKKEIASLMVGKFDYTQPAQSQQNPNMRQQQQGQMTTYVKLEDEKDVYAVDGFLKMTIGKSGDAFRDKNLTMVPRKDINKIYFDSPQGASMLEKTDGRWFYDGMSTDSIKMVKYVTTLSRMTSQDFLYENLSLGEPSYTMNIEGNNFSPIELKAYAVADTNIQYAIVSSRNPEAVFNGKKSGLFDKLWAGQETFMPDQQ